MINEENVKKLYDMAIIQEEIPTKKLNEIGFTSKDINELIELGKIKRLKRGFYSFMDIETLFLYGKELIANKKREEAIKCFEKCFELNSNHSGAAFQLFFQSINEKNYDKAFQYFEVFFQTDNKFYNNDSNFYLYLLSIITKLPDKHLEYVRVLKIEDIRVDFEDKRYKDIPLQNKIRMAVLQRKFPFALKQLTDLTVKHGYMTLQDIVTKTLLLQAIQVESKSKKDITNLIYNREYEKVVECLQEKEKHHNLSLNDTYVLKLTNILLSMFESRKVLESKIFQTDKLFEAIEGNNFELALKLSNEYNQKNNINNEENAINLLLGDICDEIKKLEIKKETNVEILKDSVPKNNEINILVDNNSIDSQKQTVVTFSEVIKSLLKNDLDNAFKTLRNYLDLINKREYEFLIVDLIKISLIEKDIAFTKPMITLTCIIRENFKFDISMYIQEFYIALSEDKFELARLYLDILSNSKKLGIEDIGLGNALMQVLNNTLVIPKSNVVKKEESTDKLLVERKEEKNNIPVKKDKKYKEPVVKKDTNDSDKDFVASKYNLLLNGAGIVLLKPMDSVRRKKIHQIVKKYPDMVSFSIGNDDNRRIVLRYKPYNKEYIDIKNLILNGNIAYKNGKYEECIECYRQLLQFGIPKAVVYAKLGLSYMKLWQKDKAIEYLFVATELSKTENRQYDFTELIDSLKGLVNEGDKKPKFKMNITDFMNDTTNYYGIDDFDEITTYILESGLDVESACRLFNKTEEETDIVKLLFARWFYQDGNYQKGDEFLKSVEISPNKTKKTKELFDIIRTNKKFYKNRERENDLKLSLKLQVK